MPSWALLPPRCRGSSEAPRVFIYVRVYTELRGGGGDYSASSLQCKKDNVVFPVFVKLNYRRRDFEQNSPRTSIVSREDRFLNCVGPIMDITKL